MSTLRFVTALFALAVVVTVTRYGVVHQKAGTHPDLVNSFTQGFNDLSQAFFLPLLGHGNPIPGRIGWLVIIGLFVFAYRELEVWAMSWQPPTVDMSALGGDQPSTQSGSASGEQARTVADQQRHDMVASELRFRLPAVSVKAPAILPGGTKVAGLVSIAESTGNSAGGLAGAIINFVGSLWPSPRQYQIRVRVEPSSKEEQATGSARVTVDLAESRTGVSIATKTLAARHLKEAGSVVAGYVARQVFSADPTAPPWCYGSFDGSDLAAMLMAWQERVSPKSSDDIRDARRTQMNILEGAASRRLCAGVPRYELAQLRDIEGYHVEALWLHAINREQYPRFYRGRYRLGMSLEMIANPEFMLRYDEQAKEILRESLRILDRCRVTREATDMCDKIKLGEKLPTPLRTALLEAAQGELCTVRRQLTLWRITWAAFVHRDERAIWKHYWRLAERQRFHDGARVAELLVAVRQSLIKDEGKGQAEQEQEQGGHPSKGAYYVRIQTRLKMLLVRYNRRRAMNITGAITGDSAAIDGVLKSEGWQPGKETQPNPHAQRTRWVPWQHSTPSWQAAYNTACLYAAVVREHREDEMIRRVVSSLERAISDRHCEMGRPSDWIEKDPDFLSVKSSDPFQKFRRDQWSKDHPEVDPHRFIFET